MSQIRIKNFGPILEGYNQNDGWIDLKKVTLFIGNQGSGKSTVAKLISTLSWIEKAMYKGVISQEGLSIYNRFLKQLAYQRIDNYTKNDTEIEYKGKAFSFNFLNGIFKVSKTPNNGYLLPKIMYAPAERNFLSVVDRPDKLKNLPAPLYTFNDEYDEAKKLYAEGITLPINNAQFEYDKLNHLAHITSLDKSYRLRLSEASSGFQSAVPLYLVTKYLSDRLVKEEDSSLMENSLEEQKKLQKEVKKISDDPQLTPDVKQAYLRELSANRRPVSFINIVEEPEENLFPLSQQALLFELVKYANAAMGNKLIMTTHSPYLINYLTHTIKAYQVHKKIKQSNQVQTLEAQLNKIVPISAMLDPQQYAIYEMNEIEGTITKLDDYKGLPSDENYLNQSLGESNDTFIKLLTLEDSCQ